MKPHKHAELIKAWADGAEIEIKAIVGRWEKTDRPTWHEDLEYRVKTQPKPWYEDIPPQGILCWVSDSVINSNGSNGIISRVYYKPENGFISGLTTWKYAKPLTREEALNLIWQEEE